MKIKEVKDIDEQYLNLLKLIDSGEYRIAKDYKKYRIKEWKTSYLFEGMDNYGIMTCMLREDYLRMQVSFHKDVNEEIIDEVEKIIRTWMKENGMAADIWMNNENHQLVGTLITRFNIPLKDVYMSRELMYFKEREDVSIEPLKHIPYSKEILMDVLNLLEDSFKAIAIPNDFIDNKEYYHEKFSNCDHSRFIGFMLENELIGMAYHHEGEIEYIGVLSKYQSKGYGKLIIHYLLNVMKEDIDNRPYLYCVDENKRGLDFYLREGFTIMAHAARL